jgi:hypothetical protein
VVLFGAIVFIVGIIGWFVSPLLSKARWGYDWLPPRWQPEEGLARRLNRVGSVGMSCLGLIFVIIGLSSN